jgi:hypothetical protein
MSEHVVLRIVVPLSLTSEVQDLISGENGSFSEAQPASSTADPLNAPVSGGDIQAAAGVVTAIFGAGLAAVKFLEALLKLSKSKGVRIKAMNAGSNVARVLNEIEDVQALTDLDGEEDVSSNSD